MPSPDSISADYNWYRKLAEWVNKPALEPAIYRENPMKAWASMVGLEAKPGTVIKNVDEASKEAMKAAGETEETLRKQRGF